MAITKLFALLNLSLLLICSVVLKANAVAAEEVPPVYDSICYKQVQIFPVVEPSFIGPRCRIVKDTLYIEGAVSSELVFELKYNTGIKHIELNSYGGAVISAYEIAEIIRDRKLSTNVRKGGKCASACTLIFQAGVKRTIYPTVRFLYHGTRLGEGWLSGWFMIREEKGRKKSVDFIATQIDEVRVETDKLFANYIKYDMSPAFLEKYKSLPEENNWFVSGNFGRTENLIVGAGELIKYNIVQDLDYRETISND